MLFGAKERGCDIIKEELSHNCSPTGVIGETVGGEGAFGPLAGHQPFPRQRGRPSACQLHPKDTKGRSHARCAIRGAIAIITAHWTVIGLESESEHRLGGDRPTTVTACLEAEGAIEQRRVSDDHQRGHRIRVLEIERRRGKYFILVIFI